MPSQKGGGDERMHLRGRPFGWPCGGVETIHGASPDAACSGLLRKPLDAAIGWLLAPYGWQQTKQRCNMNPLDGRFDGHCDAAVIYRAHRPLEEVHGKPLNAAIGRALAPILHQSDTPTPVVSYISSWKRAPVDMLAPNNNRGMTYQTDEKHLTIFSEYFVGVVKLACYSINTRFLWRVFTNNLLKIYQIGHWKNS